MTTASELGAGTGVQVTVSKGAFVLDSLEPKRLAEPERFFVSLANRSN